jgi:hypothetical protein
LLSGLLVRYTQRVALILLIELIEDDSEGFSGAVEERERPESTL